MNTRLQVEHPVTELATGIDLVREQIRVALGEPLSFLQEDVSWKGHAIECRVYAEDPANNFLPSPGRITRLRIPNGPGVRDDGGVYEGAEVSIYYDPMISKLAVVGRDRDEAIGRMRRALQEYDVAGIRTTLPFFREVMGDAEFVEGKLDTGYISRFNERKQDPQTSEIEKDILITAAALSHSKTAPTTSTVLTRKTGRWAEAARLAILSDNK